MTAGTEGQCLEAEKLVAGRRCVSLHNDQILQRQVLNPVLCWHTVSSFLT